MTPEAQRIAIAEACGWIQVTSGKWFSPQDQKAIDEKRWGDGLDGSKLPDYLNDLNAMHKAERQVIFKDVKFYLKFATELEMVVGGNIDALFATAGQRAEAFLRTKNLWKDFS